MKRKIFALGIIVVFLLTNTSAFGIKTQKNYTKSFELVDQGKSIIKPTNIVFEDADIIVIGRCRSILCCSSDNWDGGLRIGEMKQASAGIWNSSGETLRIKIQNESHYKEITADKKCTVALFNATGIFFWGAKNNDIRKIPPIIFIKCRAEKGAILFF